MRSTINWTISIVVSALLCAVLGFSAMAQSSPNAPLDAEAAATLVQELSDGLPDLIEDEAQVDSIIEKWDERQDLAGKTKEQILKILFADLRSVVKEKSIQDSVWQGWISEEKGEDETRVETPQKSAAPEVKAPEKPAVVVATEPLPTYKLCRPDLQVGLDMAPKVYLTGWVEVFNAKKGFGFIKVKKGNLYFKGDDFVYFDVRDLTPESSPQGNVEFFLSTEGTGKFRACAVTSI